MLSMTQRERTNRRFAVRMTSTRIDADRRRRAGSTTLLFADGGDDADFDAVASDDDDVIGERKTTREKDAFVTKETKKASKRHLNKRLADDDPRVAKERADLELLMMDDDAVLAISGATTRASPSTRETPTSSNTRNTRRDANVVCRVQEEIAQGEIGGEEEDARQGRAAARERRRG